MWYIVLASLTGGLALGVLLGSFWRRNHPESQKEERASEGPDTRAVIHLDDWAVLATGESGWVKIEQAWLRKAQELYQTFCQKQHDYGPTNIGVGGLRGVTARIGDKTSRLWELSGLASTGKETEGNAVNGESLRDTLLDLGDYGIIGTLVLDGDWPAVTAKEVWGVEALQKIIDEIENSNSSALGASTDTTSTDRYANNDE